MFNIRIQILSYEDLLIKAAMESFNSVTLTTVQIKTEF